MASGDRARRRSHIKSKAGCLTCRFRHIRCDEQRPQWSAKPSEDRESNFHFSYSRNCLRRGSRCDFSNYSERPIRTAYEITSLGKLLAEISMSIDETTPLEFLPLLKHPPPTQPVEDLRMTHHVSQITTELVKNGGHLMSHGTSVLPKSVFVVEPCWNSTHRLQILGISCTPHLCQTRVARSRYCTFELPCQTYGP